MKNGKIIRKILVFLTLIVLLVDVAIIGRYFAYRNHGKVIVASSQFVESAKELDNPYRGFYNIYGFVITDEEQNYSEQVESRLKSDSNELAQIQVNLRNYSSGMLSQAGIENIDTLFEALLQQEKQYIVRFLYDWSGKAKETEPESIDIILLHMQQLKTIFLKYKDIIFVHQGIFVGDCGEMHDSKYLSEEDMESLMLQLVAVTDQKTYLSVRTPAQWRRLTKLIDVTEQLEEEQSWAYRLGLYNDGMMGTKLDTGTYGTKNKEEAEVFEKWNREDELAFQEKLCRSVPNGGEVIIENPMNDFENAVQDMATMHVTYLNQGYDAAVLNKWAGTTVYEEGCFDGMDGLSYIERHLGYRLLIAGTAMFYDFWQDTLSVEVTLQNIGFAPVYKKPGVYMVLSSQEGTVIQSYQLSADVRKLAGGNEKEEALTIQKNISLAGCEDGTYFVDFYIIDPDTGKHIMLANEQDEDVYGYRLGTIEIDPIKNPITGEEIKFQSCMGDWKQKNATK